MVMKKLMSSRPSGLAIIEVILVMTISALLFGVVIGTFATRRKAAVDDGARQVMSEIAKVRNQAQQGQATTSPGDGFELFGQAIWFGQNTSNRKTITVYSLRQNRSTDVISSYATYTIPMPAGLQYWVVPGQSSDECATLFTSCYNNASIGTNITYGMGGLMIVFRNNTGESYMLATSETGSPSYTNLANYTSAQQGNLRLAFGVPGAGATSQIQFTAATAKYYAHFNLSIPNNQRLEVVK